MPNTGFSVDTETSGMDEKKFNNALLYSICSVLIASFYFLLHTKFAIEYVDDSFSLSSAYTYIKQGLMEEIVFSAPDNPDRFLYFRKTFYVVYGSILELIGWTKGNAYIIQLVVVGLGALTWAYIFKLLGYTLHLRVLFVFLVMLMLPFFNATHRGRDDPLTMLAVAVALLLFIQRRYLFAGLIAIAACEIHPMGSLALFFIAGYAATQYKELLADKKLLTRNVFVFVAGTLLGIGYYAAMHCDMLSVSGIMDRLFRANQFDGKVLDPIRTYYFIYYPDPRYLAESIFFTGALYFYIRNKYYRENPLPGVLIIMALLQSYITGRPNSNYLIFIYAPLIMMALWSYEKKGLITKAFIIIFIYYCGLYSYRYWENRNYEYDRIAGETAAAVAEDGLPVIGLPDNWFVFRDRRFIPIYNRKDITTLNLPAFYLIRNDYVAYKYPDYYPTIDYFEKNYEREASTRFAAFDGNFVEVIKYVKP